MRTTHALNGFATLALLAALTACGGGGDAGAPLTPSLPVGTLKVSDATTTAANGTFVEEALSAITTTTGTDTVVEIDFPLADPSVAGPFLIVTYNTSTKALKRVEYDVGTGPSAEFYICDETAGTAAGKCSTGGVTLDTVAGTITLTNRVLQKDSTSTTQTLKLNGTIQWTPV